jgi:hypothetical protein
MLPTIATGNVGSALAGEFEVANSLRFDRVSSDYLNRTPASAGDTKKASFSCWFKLTELSATRSGAYQTFHSVYDGLNRWVLTIDDLDRLFIGHYNGTSWDLLLVSSQKLRDMSAFYNLIVIIDTSQATSSNRVKIFLNNSQVTNFDTETYPSLNFNGIWCKNSTTEIGRYAPASAQYGSFYLAESICLDGIVASTTDFGEFDEDTGIWKPIDVSGLTFGTNGFYLDFENSGSLGNDKSGNGNNFTVNNLTSIDQTTDTCTNNFATMNPLVSVNSSNFSEGNLKINLATNDDTAFSSIAVSNGKWYWEEKRSTQGSRGYTGVCSFDVPEMGGNAGRDASSDFAYTDQNGVMNVSAGATSNSNTKGSALSSGDIICYAFDIDNGQLWTSVNGNVDISGTANATGLTTGKDYFYFFEDSGSGTTTIEINFGNPPFSISSGNSDGNGYGNFEYAVPSGYYALNTKNLAEYG